jgi:serine/threonine protein kinase
MATMAHRDPPTSSARRTSTDHPRTEHLPSPLPVTVYTGEAIRHHLRHMGITEEVLIHDQDFRVFLQEKGITELGRGGEGAVYFLRGHVVKVVNSDCAAALLREIAHMLHLNRNLRGGTMGERARLDWPSLLWVYTLSDGSLSIGMKPFDIGETSTGSTLYERLGFGPTLEREQTFRAIKSIAVSLLYCERQGIIHHDLKPANIYIPGDPAQNPVVFDLGQALWRQSAWGKMWLRNEHNFHYWYNGTYRYMHHQRRLAHLGAVATSRQQPVPPAQAHALANYVPTFYDDVYSFARILRDVVQSRFTHLHPADRTTLRDFYHKLMGLQRKRKRGTLITHGTPVPAENSGIIRRITSMLKSGTMPAVQADTRVEHRWGSMEHVVPELEKVLATLQKH